MVQSKAKKPSDDTSEDIRHQCLSFFRELKKRGLIRGVVSDLGEELVDALNGLSYKPSARGGGGSELTRQSFKNFDVKENCGAGLALCEAVRMALPRIESLRRLEGVREIYVDAFDRPFDVHDSGSGYELYNRTGQSPLDEHAVILGDYMMFRCEERDSKRRPRLTVSRSFLRFYQHPYQGVRFMMLSISEGADYTGAKGWVHDLIGSYLCPGQILDRSQAGLENEKVVGGTTAMVINTDLGSKFTFAYHQPNDPVLIDATPLLHLRSAYNRRPSLARGYLVRCNGLEKFGGKREQTPSARYEEMRSLQEKLVEEFPDELSMEDAASDLSQYTGLPEDVFFKNSTSNKGPSGLLVNIPFSSPHTAKCASPAPLHFPKQDSLFKTSARRSRAGVVGMRYGSALL